MFFYKKIIYFFIKFIPLYFGFRAIPDLKKITPSSYRLLNFCKSKKTELSYLDTQEHFLSLCDFNDF